MSSFFFFYNVPSLSLVGGVTETSATPCHLRNLSGIRTITQLSLVAGAVAPSGGNWTEIKQDCWRWRSVGGRGRSVTWLTSWYPATLCCGRSIHPCGNYFRRRFLTALSAETLSHIRL